MKKAILLVDGENFLFKVKQVLEHEKINKKDVYIPNIQFIKLIDKIFSEYKDLDIKEKRFYSAKLSVYKESKEKSLKLIRSQRILKSNLEKQGIKVILSGNVRAQNVVIEGKSKTIFKEKGVDVQIAVDMVSFACEKIYDTIILCSSDSDLQPAIYEAKRRGMEIVYLGFEMIPNKGLTYTSDKTVLFRNPEILDVITKIK